MQNSFYNLIDYPYRGSPLILVVKVSLQVVSNTAQPVKSYHLMLTLRVFDHTFISGVGGWSYRRGGTLTAPRDGVSTFVSVKPLEEPEHFNIQKGDTPGQFPSHACSHREQLNLTRHPELVGCATKAGVKGQNVIFH